MGIKPAHETYMGYKLLIDPHLPLSHTCHLLTPATFSHMSPAHTCHLLTHVTC